MSQSNTVQPERPEGRKAPGRNGFTYKPQFGLIVRCRTEAEQQTLYQRMIEEGYQPRVVCV